MPGSRPATNSIAITPPITAAARRPASAAASTRVRSPGKATAQPMEKPAAPARVTAESSVTPWIISQPVAWKPRPWPTNSARKAPSMQPL